MRHSCRQNAMLLPVAIILAFGCTQYAQGEQKGRLGILLEESDSLGEAPTIAPDAVDTVILGSPQAAAEALLEVTYDERSALACVPLLLSRLDECREKMDDATLIQEEGQPLWMRLYRDRTFSTRKQTRKHQVLLRLADCIREASPSLERRDARRQLFKMLATDFLTDPYYARIAARAVIFVSPFEGNVRSESGWKDLFDLYEGFVFSDALHSEQLNDISSTYIAYCGQYPTEKVSIVEKYGRVFGESFAAFLEVTKTANFVQPYCSERDYRTLRDKSTSELVKSYAGKDYREAASVIEGLLVGTDRARIESFPLVKPFLETYRKNIESYYHWIPLLARYCLPVAENASSEEIERQQWLLDELIGQVDRNERGDPKFGTDPIRLLRNMILPVTDVKDQEDSKHVRNPYGKERVLNVLLDQTVSTDTHAARSALRELEVLCKFDDNTARSIEQGLTARKESILTKEYPSDDLSATSKEDIYKAMEHTIKRAQAELK